MSHLLLLLARHSQHHEQPGWRGGYCELQAHVLLGALHVFLHVQGNSYVLVFCSGELGVAGAARWRGSARVGRSGGGAARATAPPR